MGDIAIGLESQRQELAVSPLQKFNPHEHSFNNDTQGEPTKVSPLNLPHLFTDQGRRSPERDERTDEFNTLYEQNVRNQFDYYAYTRGLEIGTDRVSKLQAIVDKMLDGTKKTAPVVIMNNGWQPDGFVPPDGTVFISQSLLNRLDTLDEVGSILAHEVNHLIHETSERENEVEKQFEKLALGSIHEMNADIQTIQLMEKAGLNTRAFESAIRKISPDGSRDLAHQTGLTRSVYNAGLHYMRDSKTSHIPETPLDPMFKTETVIPTNQELLMSYLKEYKRNLTTFDPSPIIQALPSLHGRDLHICTEFLEPKSYAQPDAQNTAIRTKIADALFTEMDSRLMSAGYSQTEKDFFYSSLQKHEQFRSFLALHPIQTTNSPGEASLVNALHTLTRYIDNGDHSAVYQALFKKSTYIGYRTSSAVVGFSEMLSKHPLFDPEKSNLATPEAAIEILTTLAKYNEKGLQNRQINCIRTGMHHEDYHSELQQNEFRLSYEMQSYARSYFSRMEGIPQEERLQKLKHFFTKAKEGKIILNFGQRNSIADSYERANLANSPLKEYYETLAEVYGFSLVKEQERVLTIEEIITEEIEQKFANPESTDYGDIRIFANALDDVERRTHWENISNTDLADKICNTIDLLDIHTEDYPHEAWKNKTEKDSEGTWTEQDSAIINYVLKMTVTGKLLKNEPHEYLNRVKTLMETSGIDLNALTTVQEMNLASLALGSVDMKGGAASSKEYRDYIHFCYTICSPTIPTELYDDVMRLPFTEHLTKTLENWQLPTTISEFDAFIQRLHTDYQGLHLTSWIDDEGIFEKHMESIIMGRPLRKQLATILTQPISVEEYSHLQAVLQSCLPKLSDKPKFMQRIHVGYLDAPTVSLTDKITYLKKNFESTGPKGMEIVANHIHTYEEYLSFRNAMGKRLAEYLARPSGLAQAVTIGDYAASQFNEHFTKLLDTAITDPDVTKRVNTTVAKQWTRLTIQPQENQYQDYSFNPKTDLISVRSRVDPPTPKDIADRLSGLPEAVKMYLVVKSLTDQRGAFATKDPDARKRLANIVHDVLKTPPGFVDDVLQTAITTGDEKLLSLFTGKTLAPLLFRNLDAGAADYAEILKHDFKAQQVVNSPEHLKRLATSHGWEISMPGQFADNPNSQIYQMARELYPENRKIMDLLDTVVLPETATEEKKQEKDPELSPAMDSIISGIEFSSAMGRRSLQLARQLRSFPTPIERRLNNSLDSNKGINKLLGWENLHLQIEADPDNLGQFVQNQFVSLGSYAGGGSLFTTFYAKIKDTATGETIDEVMRMLNPNAESILEENYTAAKEIIDTLKSTFQEKWASEIETMELLLDLSHTWCIQDIKDKTFQKDDQAFRTVLPTLQPKDGTEFYAPEVDFYSPKVRFEREAKGQTVNIVLADPEVPEDVKADIVSKTAHFYHGQLTTNRTFKDEKTGKLYRKVQSDPHVGNYIVDLSGDHLRFAVIDRDMYLKLSDPECHFAESLIQDTNSVSLLNQFLDLALEKRNSVQKLQTKARVASAIGAQAMREVGKPVDRFKFFQKVLSTLPANDMPTLEQLLSMRNITNWDILLDRYNEKWTTE